ncbi:MAG TPA: hypothetical protein ENG09_06315 [Candidatus Syntrophoarchaeum butanivorans]|uniref:Uncharacterized protein n=1 Tax=Candidatus Syntropharchaeum butanivorans TaxID=1839936 RepID=A0A1F2P5P3_9EURY|nr:MAG: hypothetical protein SBU_000624 [Candidatus Syntrophoarchaeum butanivorans]HDM36838.1 hypothetical protein [Candidatus Syntrophoarchaeum butanivorans]HEC56359.1 hypothetical protein [Candidatus Syntrophoarchaeum butanivorans]
MSEVKKLKLKIKSEGKRAKSEEELTAGARKVIEQLYSDPTPEREDGLDRIYSKEELEGYDEFMKRFGIDDPLVGIREFHRRYGDIINNPQRREILKTLVDAERTFDDICAMTGIDRVELERQLLMLDFCVDKFTKDGKTYYKLTKIGSIIKKF